MNPYIPLTTCILLTMAYFAPLMLLLVASNTGLAVIEMLEEAGN